MERSVYIYGLVDPRTDEVRYVGKTTAPRTRLRQHLNEARRGVLSHRNNWLREVLASDNSPTLIVLAETSDDEWETAECCFIDTYRLAGRSLVNGSAGGEGVVDPTPEARLRLAAAQRGKVMSPASRARMSASKLALVAQLSPEEIQARILAMQTAGRQPAVIKRQADAQRGVKRGVSLSVYMGVSPRPKGRWCSRVAICGKQHQIGTYGTEIEAAEAYDRFVIERIGPHAKTNFGG